MCNIETILGGFYQQHEHKSPILAYEHCKPSFRVPTTSYLLSASRCTLQRSYSPLSWLSFHLVQTSETEHFFPLAWQFFKSSLLSRQGSNDSICCQLCRCCIHEGHFRCTPLVHFRCQMYSFPTL